MVESIQSWGAGSFAFYPPLQICGSSTKKIFFFFLSFFFYREIITFIFYRARERKEGEGCGRGSKYFLSKKFIPRTFLANIIYNGWLVYSTIWMIINNKKKCILSCVLSCIIHHSRHFWHANSNFSREFSPIPGWANKNYHFSNPLFLSPK